MEIPLLVKLAYTAFMAVLVPVYLRQYGWTNFLYFCDIALVFTLAGVWLESPLLISMCAVGLLLPQTLWVADYIFNLFGMRTTGLTNYMFESHRSVFLRALSLFHGWLPFLLLYLVWELGYDGRGLIAWTIVSCIVLPVCYWLMPPAQPDPGMTPVNINMVWGLDDRKPQSWMPPNAWFALLFFGLPVAVYWPTHLLLQYFFHSAPSP